MPRLLSGISMTLVILIALASLAYGVQWLLPLAMGNKSHGQACYNLPTVNEVKTVLEQEQTLMQRLRTIQPGHVSVDIDDSKCLGRADILITVDSAEQSVRVQQLIAGDTLRGIPFRILNQ